MQHFFAESSDADKEQKVKRLLETSSTRRVVQTATLMEVLNEVAGTDDGKEFQDLRDIMADEQREQMIRKRLFSSKGKAEHETPSPIKGLKPDYPGVVLTYQIPANAFIGYYPKDLTEEQRQNRRLTKNWSQHRTFGEKWTSFEALKQVVVFLWGCHAKLKRVPGSASASDVWVCVLKIFVELDTSPTALGRLN